MKKLLIAFVIFVYLVPVSLILIYYILSTRETYAAIFLIPLSLMLLVCALVFANIICAVYSLIYSRTLTFKTVMIFKLSLIPFYIVNFACWLTSSMVFHIAIIVWPFIPYIIVYTYFTIFGTSVYVITKLLTLRRDRIITTKQFIIHTIWQIVFLADVIDSIYLSIKNKTFETKLAI
jgi:hypothetical protein